MHLVHNRRLADPGIAGDQHELRRGTSHDTLERREQDLDLALTPVKFLRNEQPVWRVALAQREVIDASVDLELRETPPQVSLQASRGLIALVCCFREQLHDDR